MGNQINKNFGKKVRALRKSLGLTQEQLAEKIGISVISVANIESGRSGISFSKLEVLAKALDVKTFRLFTDIEVAKSDTKGEIIALMETMSEKQATAALEMIKILLLL